MTLARHLILAAAAAVVGSLWGWYLLSDGGSAGVAGAVALYFATGAAFGAFLGHRWWLGSVAGWPAIMLGVLTLFGHSPSGILYFPALGFLPALLGAYLAHRLRGRLA